MKRTLLVVALAGLVAATLVPASLASTGGASVAPVADRGAGVSSLADGAPGPAAAVPGEIVVTYRRNVATSRRSDVAARMGAQVVARAAGLGMQTLRLPAGASVDAAIRRLNRTAGVVSADPNFRLYPMGGVPNDTFFTDQWGLLNTGQDHFISDPPPADSSGKPGSDVDAMTAWDTTTGAAGSVIAVIDTGVDVDHPDLVNQLVAPSDWRNVSGSGAVGNPRPATGEPHGTHVAGIIAAQQGNNAGISGVCPSCKILPIRFGFTLSSEVQAINWAKDHDADVINASFGGAPWNKTERNAIKKAGKAGVLFVAAAGNNSADNDVATFSGGRMISPSFPASYELGSILSVAASNHKDQYGYFTGCVEGDGNSRAACSFTSFGRTSVDVAAPGTDIISTVTVGEGTRGPSQEYDTYNGTSMASPMVAGIAGLVKTEHPGYSLGKVKNAIMNGVDKPNGLKKYLRITTCTPCSLTAGQFTRTNGRVDAGKALGASTKNATKKDDGTIAGAKPIATSKSGAIDWPSDPNDIFKKSLKKGKRYRITVKAKTKALDFYLWNPTTVDLWQLSAGCPVFGGSGPCALLGGFPVKGGKTTNVTFKATKGGVHYFQLSSFYQTAKASYALTVKLA